MFRVMLILVVGVQTLGALPSAVLAAPPPDDEASVDVAATDAASGDAVMSASTAKPRIPLEAIKLEGLDPQAADQQSLWRTTHRCGVNALYSYLRLRGVAVDYDELLTTLPISADGTTLEDLRLASQDYRHDAVIVATTPAKLAEVLPAIVHCEQELGQSGHYNVVVDSVDGQVCFIDGTTGVFKCVSSVEFMKYWTGYTLCSEAQVRRALAGKSGHALAFYACAIAFACGSTLCYWRFRCPESSKATP